MRILLATGLALLLACGSSDSDSSGAPAETVPTSGDTTPGDSSPVVATPVWTTPAAGKGSDAPYPFVFMHGMAGFAQLDLGVTDITYYDGVVEDLTKRGEQVFVTIVPPYDTSEARAVALSKQIDQILVRTGKTKVNLIAHSQGGLDARIIASPNGLGYGDRIASVTTIATPHHGTKVADGVLGLTDALPSVVNDLTNDFLHLLEKSSYELSNDPHLQAQIHEMSVKNMTDVFNPTYVDDARVAYASYAGRTNLRSGTGVCDGGKIPNQPSVVDPAQAIMAGTALYLEHGGDKIVNDGLVTVESAKWGVFVQCVAADHLKEVGQIGVAADNFDHLQFYRDVTARVRASGF